MNNWGKYISYQRTGENHSQDQNRTDFQRDFDRLIFSTSFRRLQNKTQVFPLPGSTLVHNRLTHSLEVASVGRTLGNIVGKKISAGLNDMHQRDFYLRDLANVIGAACLAHDIGNPAFGHSGEKAISSYFKSNAKQDFSGKPLVEYFNNKEWADLINFEGNANALRLLTRKYHGKSNGGLKLNLTTLASIIKYPCASHQVDKKYKHRKKYGYFQSDKSAFDLITDATNMVTDTAGDHIYQRHPFVYLVEAADDICYRIMDMEDAHRLGILDRHVTKDCFWAVMESLLDDNKINSAKSRIDSISDPNESIAYLRANCINALILNSSELFLENQDRILAGEYKSTLLDDIEDLCPPLVEMMDISVNQIYNHSSVLEIEIAGYNVMNHLLQLFVPYVLNSEPSNFNMKITNLVPAQFRPEHYPDASPYERTMLILDYVSGMTDIFAAELYRKLTGIEFSVHK